MKNFFRRYFSTFLFSHLFKLVTEADVLRQNAKGQFVHKGAILTQKQINFLAEEAETIKSLSAFNVVLEDLELLACKKIYDESLSTEDVRGGKMILYTTDIIRKKFETLSKLKK